MTNVEPGAKKPAILFISYYFYPSPEVGARRPTATVRFLAEAGYDVTVVRALERDAEPCKADEVADGVRVVSIAVPHKLTTSIWRSMKRLRGNGGKRVATAGGSDEFTSSIASRRGGVLGWLRRQFLAFDTSFQGYKLWLFKVVLRVAWLRLRNRADLVIASGPPFVAYISGYYASRFHAVPLVLDFRDPWYLHGDAERKTEILGHPAANWENRYGQRCVSRADMVIVASPGIRRHCNEVFEVADTRIELVRNGYDESAVISAPVPHGRLELLYAGSLYWNRNPFPFLECLRAVTGLSDVDRSKVRFTLVGDCADWEGVSLADWLDAHDMNDVVRILPGVVPVELKELVAASNVLVNFAQGQPRQIPAKSYEYLASERDVITIAEQDSDVADLFREARVGRTVSPDDTSGLRAAILACYRKYTGGGGAIAASDRSGYSRRRQSARFREHLDDVLAGHRDNH